MTNTTYRTLEVQGVLTIKRVRRFRVPSYVSDEAFQEAIDSGYIDVDCRDTCYDEWLDIDDAWEITPQGYGYAFCDKGADLGGEDVDGIFPDKKTVRLEITAPASTIYTFNVPADTDLEHLEHLISTSSSYSAAVDLLFPAQRSGLVPESMPSTTRVLIDELNYNEHALNAAPQLENLYRKKSGA